MTLDLVRALRCLVILRFTVQLEGGCLMSKPIDDALNTTSDDHAYVRKFNRHKDVPAKKDHGAEIDKDYEYSKHSYIT